jgi:hypothetical protein
MEALLPKLRAMSVDGTTLHCIVTFWTGHDCPVVWPPKRPHLFIIRHGVTSRKTWLFVITAVRTPNLLHETPKHTVFYISYCQHAVFHPLLLVSHLFKPLANLKHSYIFRQQTEGKTVLYQAVVGIPRISSRLNFSMRAILMCCCRSQVFDFLHSFKRLISYIVLPFCPKFCWRPMKI